MRFLVRCRGKEGEESLWQFVVSGPSDNDVDQVFV